MAAPKTQVADTLGNAPVVLGRSFSVALRLVRGEIYWGRLRVTVPR